MELIVTFRDVSIKWTMNFGWVCLSNINTHTFDACGNVFFTSTPTFPTAAFDRRGKITLEQFLTDGSRAS